MILDEFIAFFAGFFIAAFAVVAIPVIFLINAVSALIEFIVGIFSDGFTIPRIQRKKKERSKIERLAGWALFVVILGTVFWVIAWPRFSQREITIVAADGYVAPLASLIIEKGEGHERSRTDTEGKVTIPRFGVTALVVKDARYVEKKWLSSEIDDELSVERTVLGSGLDFLKDQLLKPKNPQK